MGTPRPLWKGTLKMSLVMIPVKMFSTSQSSAEISFNLMHATCQSRTKQKKWCPTCDKEIVGDEEIIKGYEFEKGKYVLFPGDELDALSDDASKTIDITTVTAEAINPLYIDGAPSYLVADDAAGQQGLSAFETIRVALGNRRAVGTVTMRNKTRHVALEATPEGFVIYWLSAAAAVRTFADIGAAPLTIIPPKAEMTLASQLLATLEGEFDYEDVVDEWTLRVRAAIDAKVKGEAPPVPLALPKAAAVNLHDALTKSIQLAQAAKKLPAKAPQAKVTAPTKSAAKKKAS
jgi:DNA end-binding protein Ku